MCFFWSLSWNIWQIMASAHVSSCFYVYFKFFFSVHFFELPKYQLLLGKLNYACEIPRCIQAYRKCYIVNGSTLMSDDISAVFRSAQIRLMCFTITIFFFIRFSVHPRWSSFYAVCLLICFLLMHGDNLQQEFVKHTYKKKKKIIIIAFFLVVWVQNNSKTYLWFIIQCIFFLSDICLSLTQRNRFLCESQAIFDDFFLDGFLSISTCRFNAVIC